MGRSSLMHHHWRVIANTCANASLCYFTILFYSILKGIVWNYWNHGHVSVLVVLPVIKCMLRLFLFIHVIRIISSAHEITKTWMASTVPHCFFNVHFVGWTFPKITNFQILATKGADIQICIKCYFVFKDLLYTGLLVLIVVLSLATIVL